MAEDKRDAAPAPKLNVDISDEDIYDAMSHVSGYIDITTEDFHEIYHLAFRHAIERLVGRSRVADMMTREVVSVPPEAMLDEVARTMAARGVKGVPVVDEADHVLGLLSQTDFLRQLGTPRVMEFLVRFVERADELGHRLHETRADAVMTRPAVTLREDASFPAIIQVFKQHPVSRVPVVDASGRLVGMLTRKDFMHACKLETIA